MKTARFLSITILLGALTLSVPQTFAKAGSDSEKELARLETVWNEAHMKGDATALDKLWAEDLIVTMPDMPIMNKKDALAIWKSGKLKFRSYKTYDIRIRVYGNSAVVTGQLERRRTNNIEEFEDDWRFTKVYVRRGGKWLVVAWHGSHVGTSNQP